MRTQKVLQAEQERLEKPDETGATMTACPPPQFLEQLLEETLAGHEREQVSAHVAVCRECQQRLEVLTDTSALFSVRRRRRWKPTRPICGGWRPFLPATCGR
jgi:hypothetical protein